MQIGPDGAVYLADWYSVQLNHYRNHEGETNPELGRIYRLRGRAPLKFSAVDLARLSSEELVRRYLDHPNRTCRQLARRVLGDRRDESVVPMLWSLVQERSGHAALEAFWALHVSGGLDARRLAACLEHENSHVRRWAVQIIGDRPEQAETWQNALLRLAQNEPDIEVRCQLAATAKRLPPEVAMPLVFALLEREEDTHDIYIPKTLWWSLEAHADDADLILKELATAEAWQNGFRVAESSMAQNLMRRYTMSGRQSDLEICARLLQLAPQPVHHDQLVEAFVTSFAGRRLPALPDNLARELSKAEGPFAQLMAIRQLDPTAVANACQSLSDTTISPDQRIALIQALGDVQAAPETTIPALSAQLSCQQSAAVTNAVLLALQKYQQPRIGAALIEGWPTLPSGSQSVAVQVLASRHAWATVLVASIVEGRIPSESIDADIVARLRRYQDDSLQAKLDDLYPAEKNSLSDREARLEALAEIAKQGQGSPVRGESLYYEKASCGKCHKLFNKGQEIGPDLTPYNRSSLSRMLLAIVSPSAEIREGYDAVTVLTDDGRLLSGLKMEETEHMLFLRGTDGQNQTIPTSQIDVIEPSTVSLMPEGLLESLTDEEIRDLLAFLSSTTPPR